MRWSTGSFARRKPHVQCALGSLLLLFFFVSYRYMLFLFLKKINIWIFFQKKKRRRRRHPARGHSVIARLYMSQARRMQRAILQCEGVAPPPAQRQSALSLLQSRDAAAPLAPRPPARRQSTLSILQSSGPVIECDGAAQRHSVLALLQTSSSGQCDGAAQRRSTLSLLQCSSNQSVFQYDGRVRQSVSSLLQSSSSGTVLQRDGVAPPPERQSVMGQRSEPAAFPVSDLHALSDAFHVVPGVIDNI
jgi:hypothetical protein